MECVLLSHEDMLISDVRVIGYLTSVWRVSRKRALCSFQFHFDVSNQAPPLQTFRKPSLGDSCERKNLDNTCGLRGTHWSTHFFRYLMIIQSNSLTPPQKPLQNICLFNYLYHIVSISICIVLLQQQQLI